MGDLTLAVREAEAALLAHATAEPGGAHSPCAALSRGRDVADPYTRARLYWAESRLRGEQGRLDEGRIQRVTAFGDKKTRNANAMDPANNRIEVILLR